MMFLELCIQQQAYLQSLIGAVWVLTMALAGLFAQFLVLSLTPELNYL